MLHLIAGRREPSPADIRRQALLLLDQLERAHLYLTSALDLEAGDADLEEEVRYLHADLTGLIHRARRVRLL